MGKVYRMGLPVGIESVRFSKHVGRGWWLPRSWGQSGENSCPIGVWNEEGETKMAVDERTRSILTSRSG